MPGSGVASCCACANSSHWLVSTSQIERLVSVATDGADQLMDINLEISRHALSVSERTASKMVYIQML